jgi:yeast amino acid transporter
VVITAAEILAVTELFRFQFTKEYLEIVDYPGESITWSSTVGVNPAVWVGIFLLIVLLLNLLPVRQYGRVEYICGCAKIMMLVLLIMFNIIINARQRFHDSRFWTYESPWSFSTQNMTLSNTKVLTGDLGRFTAFWTTMTTTIFSLLGMEVILFTAAENADLERTETIKLSSRKISLRIILLYALATFTVGLNVPYSDDNLRSLTINGITGGENSAFVIASVREHVTGLPNFINGFFIFSATSTGANALYSASRTLHAIASIPDAWPNWKPVEAIRSRLERTKYGVPMNAVFLSWSVGFLAFLSVNTEATEVSLFSNRFIK